MIDVLRSYLLVASGVGQLTRRKAVEVAQQLVAANPVAERLPASPEAVRAQVSALADELLDVGRQQRTLLTELVRAEVEAVVTRLGLTAAERTEELQAELAAARARVHDLERELASRPAAAPVPAPAEPAPAEPAAAAPRKAATRRPAAKKAAQPPAGPS